LQDELSLRNKARDELILNENGNDISFEEQMDSDVTTDDEMNSKDLNVDMWLDDTYFQQEIPFRHERGDRNPHYSTPKVGGSSQFPGKVSVGLRNRNTWQDSDSDAEDFQHVFSESQKAFDFTKSTILHFQRRQVNGSMIHDPAEYMEPLATCQTNIQCLEELIEALEQADRLDGDIFQIQDIVKKWKELELETFRYQEEAKNKYSIYLELVGVEEDIRLAQRKLDSCRLTDIRKVDETITAVQFAQNSLILPINIRLETCERSWKSFKEENCIEFQLTDTDFKFEAVKKAASSLIHKCASELDSLHAALMTFYKFSELERDLTSLLSQESRQVECLDSAKDVVDFSEHDLHDNIIDLKSMQRGWSTYDEKLKSLMKLYSDMMSHYPESALQFLKHEISLTCASLTKLKRKNHDLVDILAKTENQSRMEDDSTWDQCTSVSKAGNRAKVVDASLTEKQQNKATGKPKLIPGNQNAGVLRMIHRLLKYALPLSVAVLLFGWLYLMDGSYGDSGLIFFPSLQHIRGPPPT
jgi:hypothetical protein